MPRREKAPGKRKNSAKRAREPERKPRLTKAEKTRRERISQALQAHYRAERERRARERERSRARREEARRRRLAEEARKRELAERARERRWEKKLALAGGAIVRRFRDVVVEGQPTPVVKAAVAMYYDAKAMLRDQAHSSAQYLAVLQRIQDALHLDHIGWNIVY